jgi:hypothetical protein
MLELARLLVKYDLPNDPPLISTFRFAARLSLPVLGT